MKLLALTLAAAILLRGRAASSSSSSSSESSSSSDGSRSSSSYESGSDGSGSYERSSYESRSYGRRSSYERESSGSWSGSDETRSSGGSSKRHSDERARWQPPAAPPFRHVRDGVYRPHGAAADVRRAYVCQSAGRPALRLSEAPCPDAKGPVASAVLKDAINQTGWAYLDVVGNGNYSNKMMAYAAGMAEAAVSHDLIGCHKANTMYTECVAPATPAVARYCARLHAFLEENVAWMLSMAHVEKSDPYWQHVKLVLYQLTGMEDAYDTVAYGPARDGQAFRPRIHIGWEFIWFQLGGDLEDLEQALGMPASRRSRRTGAGHCSALVKPLRDNADLVVAHDTWSPYTNMLRVLKRYSLPYVNRGAACPGSVMSFSSYPGTLLSVDDFYTTSAKLVVTETTIGNGNATLWQYVRPRSVLTWLRATVANRLAANGAQWLRLFELHNSGTYNNQWMVVDYKRFKAGQPLPQTGLFYVLEQLPGKIVSADLSALLSTQGYWPSYNSPYFKEIFNASGALVNVRKYGDWFTYERSPRALIFKRDWHRVVDMRSLAALMRYNDYKHDPLSRCEACRPPYSAENAISARCELNPKDGTYPFATLGHRDHGGIDMKAVNSSMVDAYAMLAISGPSCDQQPVFRWSAVDFGNTTKHLGQPDEWNFPYVFVDWEKV